MGTNQETRKGPMRGEGWVTEHVTRKWSGWGRGGGRGGVESTKKNMPETPQEFC